MTLEEIKEKKLGAVINTKTKHEAMLLVKILGVDKNRFYDETDFINVWDAFKENTCYRVVDGKVDMSDCVKYYQNINEKIYELSDLFATGGVVSIHDLPTSEWYNLMRLKFKNGSFIEALPQKDDTVSGDRIAYAPDGSPLFAIPIPVIKEEKKLKFTFYVKEGTRVDKSCNGTIPTMTTNIELSDGNVFDEITTIKGSATCDKADYDERQGVLEALANAVCGGEFEKRYKKAVKANKDADLWMRTCYYCGKVFDTVEEKVAHDDWHVERRKARHERYLLRKRAKEIAFEEQAQKMAKEMIKEDK